MAEHSSSATTASHNTPAFVSPPSAAVSSSSMAPVHASSPLQGTASSNINNKPPQQTSGQASPATTVSGSNTSTPVSSGQSWSCPFLGMLSAGFSNNTSLPPTFAMPNSNQPPSNTNQFGFSVNSNQLRQNPTNNFVGINQFGISAPSNQPPLNTTANNHFGTNQFGFSSNSNQLRQNPTNNFIGINQFGISAPSNQSPLNTTANNHFGMNQFGFSVNSNQLRPNPTNNSVGMNQRDTTMNPPSNVSSGNNCVTSNGPGIAPNKLATTNYQTLAEKRRSQLQKMREDMQHLLAGHLGSNNVRGRLQKLLEGQSSLGRNSLRKVLQKDREEQRMQKAIEVCKTDTKAKMDQLESELSNIVGLDDLKLQLQKWGRGMLLEERRRALGLKIAPRRPPHMAFAGNPGTGKTMVARLLGNLLHMVGILPTNKVIEVQRSDLVGQWIGHTGPKTKLKIQEAEGGILFVDEVYRLIPTLEANNRDFGLEALEEIMSVMDSGRVVVIFAGYVKPMERVLSSNEGLRRRVTKIFRFDDYNSEDLAKILHRKMTIQTEDSLLYGFKLHPSCSIDAIATLIERETNDKQRKEMNGGLVTTMLVNARENLDMRLGLDCKDTEELLTITLEDLQAGLQMISQPLMNGEARK